MTTTFKQLYEQLAVRVNYPITPTYRCFQKVIGMFNLLLTYVNCPQYIEQVELTGDSGHKSYTGGKVSYLEDGQPCILNPDGTINTHQTKGYVVHKDIVQSTDGTYKHFVDSETDTIVSDTYVQPILTALFTLFQGVSPLEASVYINAACTNEMTEVNMKNVDLGHIRRRL